MMKLVKDYNYTLLLCKLVVFSLVATFFLFISVDRVDALTIGKSPNVIGLSNGLVGWWTFDGKNMTQNVVDSSGSGYTGYFIHSGSGTTTIPGKLGQSLSFDSSNDYVNIGASYNGVKTISFWFKPNTISQSIIDLNGSNATITTSSGTVTAGAGFASPTIYVDGAVSSTANDTKWHHITITTNTGINASAVKIGLVSSTYYGGVMDDVRVYSRALSSTEIGQLYTLGSGSRRNVSIKGSSSLSSGLVGWWTFDGKNMIQNVVDSSGSGNTGYLSGFTSTTTVPGRVGQALYFDGSNDYVNVGTATSLDDLGPLTYAAWVYPSSNGTGWTVFEKGRIYLNQTSSKWRFFRQNTGTNMYRDSSSNVTPNTWAHVVVTWNGNVDGSNVHIYLNGVLNDGTLQVGSGSAMSDAGYNGNIGLDYSSSNAFSGKIDDVRIYNRILSASEVMQLYNMGR